LSAHSRENAARFLQRKKGLVIKSLEKARAEVEVQIHEQAAQDKSLEKLFHARIIGKSKTNLQHRTELRLFTWTVI
jgi:hypothetical protein